MFGFHDGRDGLRCSVRLFIWSPNKEEDGTARRPSLPGEKTPSIPFNPLRGPIFLGNQWATALVKIVSGQDRADVASRGRKIDAFLETMRSYRLTVCACGIQRGQEQGRPLDSGRSPED